MCGWLVDNLYKYFFYLASQVSDNQAVSYVDRNA